MARAWWGTPWPSGVCLNDDNTVRWETHIPTPVDKKCMHCEEQIMIGDRGQMMPCMKVDGVDGWEILPVHRECEMRMVMGGIDHLDGRCSCHGGRHADGKSHTMTLREEALEVWARITEGITS